MATSTESGALGPAGADAPQQGLSLQTFAAFQSRPFRLLWVNSLSFALSQAVRQFTFVWLALELSNSGRALGAISFAMGIPILVFSLPAGALADRMDRRVLLFGSQVGALVITVLAAVLVWGDALSTPVTFALALALGATVAFGAPVRTAIVPSIVEPDRLLNAVTLTSMGQNVSQIAGPALCGAIIAWLDAGAAFAFQAILLALGLVALVPLRVPLPTGRRRNLASELNEGFTFVFHHAGIRALFVALLATAIIIAGTFNTLLPKIAKEDLGAGAFGASMLFGAMGAGMLMSSLLLASLPRFNRAGLVFALTLVSGGCLSFSSGLSPWYALTLALAVLHGWNGGFFTNLNLTLVQAHTPQPIMGRVMSIYTLCMAGGMPLGALLAGAMSDVTGAREWLAICGAAFATVGVVIFLTQPALRRMRSTPDAPAEG